MPKESWNWLVADFECTTDSDDCRVWAWGMSPISHNPVLTYGNDIDSFMTECFKKHSRIYFHNLQYDGSFILNWLFLHGYEHSTEQNLSRGQFSTLIDKRNKFYNIRVNPFHGKDVEYRDSLKVIPMAVSAIPSAFGLDTDAKGSIDYAAYRAPGHCLTEDEIAYLREDVFIIAKALAQQRDEGMESLTIGSAALKRYRSVIGTKSWQSFYPVLSRDLDGDIRRSYRGGYAIAAPKFKGRVVGPIKVYDVNSLYPSVMVDCDMPYGEPTCDYGSPPSPPHDMPLWVAHVVITARLREGFLPCIQIKNNMSYRSTQYLDVIDEPVDVWVTSVDFALWQEHYDMSVMSWMEVYYFKSARGMFDEYIDNFMKIKMESEGGKRTIAKLFLNSLYGKFATNPDVTGKIPVMEDGALRFVLGEAADRDPVYVPVGTFITAWARSKTIGAAQHHYSIFAYADTDSLHMVTETDPADLDIHPTRLGAWKHEGDFHEGLYARAKCYTEHDKDRDIWSTHIAGLPSRVAETVRFADYEGKHFDGKLVPKQVPGGVVLKDVGFELHM